MDPPDLLQHTEANGCLSGGIAMTVRERDHRAKLTDPAVQDCPAFLFIGDSVLMDKV